MALSNLYWISRAGGLRLKILFGFWNMHSSYTKIFLFYITIQSRFVSRDCVLFFSTTISSICEGVNSFAPSESIVAIKATILIGLWSSGDLQAVLTNSNSWWLKENQMSENIGLQNNIWQVYTVHTTVMQNWKNLDKFHIDVKRHEYDTILLKN